MFCVIISSKGRPLPLQAGAWEPTLRLWVCVTPMKTLQLKFSISSLTFSLLKMQIFKYKTPNPDDLSLFHYLIRQTVTWCLISNME